jgi:ethanolamine utilization microcompartment shell protein EutS
MPPKTKNILLKVLPVIIVATLLVTAIIYAWQEPSKPPPQDNVPAPLNVSDRGQIKLGGLSLNAGGANIGLIVEKGKVGIGTTAPSSKLDVEAAGTAIEVNTPTDGGSIGILFNEAGANSAYIHHEGQYDTGYLEIEDYSSGWGTTGLVIKQGNIGIGTTAPQGKLSVKGGNIVLERPDASGAPGHELVLQSWSATMSSEQTDIVRVSWNEWSAGTDTCSPPPNDKVNKLQCIAGTHADGYSCTDYYIISGRWIYPYYRATTICRGGTSKYSIRTNWGTLQFLNNEDVVKLVIGQDGNVGIDTTAPSEKLEVAGNIKAEKIKAGEVCLAGVCRDSWPPGAVSYWTLTGNNLYTSSTAWTVGIGTIAPQAKLDVRGGHVSFERRLQIGNSQINWINDTITGFTEPIISSDGALFIGGYTGTEDTDLRLYITDDAKDRFSIWGDTCGGGECGNLNKASLAHYFTAGGNVYHKGNVGIGTTAPSEKLEVAGNIKAEGICLGGVCRKSWLWTLTGNNLYASSTAWNVGIGTTTPSEKLVVVGNVKVEGGHITAATPTESHHVATKGYVDDSWVIEVYRERDKKWEKVGYLDRIEWLGEGEGETGKLREVIYDREGNSWYLGADGYVYKNGEKYRLIEGIKEWRNPSVKTGRVDPFGGEEMVCLVGREAMAREACANCMGGKLVSYTYSYHGGVYLPYCAHKLKEGKCMAVWEEMGITREKLTGLWCADTIDFHKGLRVRKIGL